MRHFAKAVAMIAFLSSTSAYADGCVYAGQTYSDGAVVNGKVCDGRSGTWR